MNAHVAKLRRRCFVKRRLRLIVENPKRHVLHHGTDEAEILHSPDEYESDDILEQDRTWLHWVVLAMYKNRDIISDEAKGHQEFMDFFETRSTILKACSALLVAGAEVDARDASGRTPLHYACITGDRDLVAVLIDEGCADIEAKDAVGSTPLIQCVDTFQDEMAEDLLERGAHINAQNKSGYSCLHYACQTLTLEVPFVMRRIKGFLDRDAELLRDIHGRTPLDVVKAYDGDDEIALTLQATLVKMFKEYIEKRACERDGESAS